VPYPGRFTSDKRSGTHCAGGWVGPISLTGIRSPDLPASSELLYLLRYAGGLPVLIIRLKSIQFFMDYLTMKAITLPYFVFYYFPVEALLTK